MGHGAPRKMPPHYPPPPLPPPAPARLVPLYGVDDLIGCARREYVSGAIEADEFEAAIDHILSGGRGTGQFPYLPASPMPQMSVGKQENR